MASRKSTKKTTKTVESVAIKSAEDIAKDILQIQQKTREALSQIDAAFIDKQTELSAVIDNIKAKTSELEELHGKEEILLSIEELDEKLEDRKHETERAMKKLRIEFQDNRLELERQLNLTRQGEERRLADEARARQIVQEDEDRARKLAHEEREQELIKRTMVLDERAAELGSFDERLNKEIGKAKGMAERNAQIEIRQKETEHKAIVDILEAKLQQAVAEIADLKLRLETAETTSRMAGEKVVAIANSALDKESERKVSEKISQMAGEFASSPKR